MFGFLSFMIFDTSQIELFCQILLAALLGGIVGLEREYKRRAAGLRTFSLVCLGSCFFTLIAFNFTKIGVYPLIQIDLTRVIQAVAVGVGFIGAGLIIHRQGQVEGLTTAAGLWAVAAIGIAVGMGMYVLAVFVAFLSVLILAGFRIVEEKLFSKSSESKDER